MAPHSSTLAWKTLSCIGEGNGNPLQCSCLENPRDGGAWWAAVYGVTQSRTRLKRLSSSSIPFSSTCVQIHIPIEEMPRGVCASSSNSRLFSSLFFLIIIVIKNPSCVYILLGTKHFLNVCNCAMR